jgi:DNA-binding helix-hairpin-helix protein with protein kinase domain
MAATADAQLLKYAAWPQDTLHPAKNGPVIGFSMPKVTDRAPIHMLYSPAHRRQDYPNAGWDFLLLAARNTAAAFETLHAKGHVLGDVNQGNVMVGRDTIVTLIDCDSFQIAANGNVHLCEVGVAHFTPPELQGVSSFSGVRRTANHDNFGLALLIFHILFGGRHPYSGVPLKSDVGNALESDIKAFRYAYSRSAQRRGLAPPPRSIPMSVVTDAVEAMFEFAFNERGARGGRPTAQQWVSTLNAVRTHLKKCAATPIHVYPDHLPRCPWCGLGSQGVIYFVGIGAQFVGSATGFDLAKVWVAIEAVSLPPPLVIPNPSSFSVKAVALPPGVPSSVTIVLSRLAVVAGALRGLAVAARFWVIIIGVAWVLWAIAGTLGGSKRTAERVKRQVAMDQATKGYATLKARMQQSCGPEGFTIKKMEFAELRDEYKALPVAEKTELERLHATAHERQLYQFLDRCFIDSATVPGVGPTRKATLRSFGIETAADVEWTKVRAIDGFGDMLTRAMVDWKKTCERQFVFSPDRAVTEADKAAVRSRFATRRRSIEAALAAGAQDLQRFRQIAGATASSLEFQLRAAAQRLAQARADFSLIK